MNKKCVFIIVYFGEFNNYFQFFLDSCKFNKEYSWFIFTDNNKKYNYPNNCIKVEMSLTEFNELATKKIGVNINVQKPYKLCDFKPAYGLIFEDYIKDYEYWAHCDCDLIFGNLNQFLPQLFCENYDKIFAAGHLTIYKNTKENNTIFMKDLNKQKIYKKIFTSNEIFAFDEDCNKEKYFQRNIHSIFINEQKKIFTFDYSLNPKVKSAKIINVNYSEKERDFVPKRYVKSKYYWDNGSIYSIDVYGERKEYLYAHFQMRKMRCKFNNLEGNVVEILPDRFVSRKSCSNKISFVQRIFIGFPYLFWFDYYMRKIKRRKKVD